MKRIRFVRNGMLIGFAWLLLPLALHGRPGQVDSSFDTSSGVSHPVRILGARSDGHIVIRGWFDGPGGQSKPGVARLLPDGRLDRVFSASTNADGSFESVDFLPDGRMLIAGSFSSLQGLPRPGLARLLADGDLDPDYAPLGVNVRGIRVHADGRVLAEVADTRGLVRLRPDGSVDPSFRLSPSVAEPSLVGLLSRGRVLVARTVKVGENLQSELIRLEADGDEDPTFEPTILGEAGIPARLVTEQSDGALVIFELSVRRVNPNGGWDFGFSTRHAQAAGSIDDHWLQAVAAGPDGSLFIGGRIETKHPDFMGGDDAFELGYIRRVSPADGGLDATFAVTLDAGPPGRPSAVSQIVVQANGQVLVAGQFSAVNGIGRRYLARLDSQGRSDVTFNSNQGADGPVFAILPLADGKVLLGGTPAEPGVIGQRSVVRLLASGAADSSFEAIIRRDKTYGPPVLSLAGQEDGRILAGTLEEGIRTIRPDGSPDGPFPPTASPEQGWPDDECRVLIQTDGRILVGGIQYFNPVTQTPALGVARFQADGSPDPSFDPRLGANGAVRVLALDSQGNILVAGDFMEIAGTPRIGLARLLPDGHLDARFHAGLRTNETVLCLASQSDGKLLVGGLGNTLAGVHFNGVARLSSDGQWDRSFVAHLARFDGSPPDIHAITIQADSKIIIGGAFDTIEGVPRRNIARLNPNGSLDQTFDPGLGPNGAVLAIALRPNGRILIGGEFRAVDGVPRHHVAQLLGRPEPDVVLGPMNLVAGRPVFEIVGVTERMASVETSPDFIRWTRRETLRIGPRPVLYSDGDSGTASRRFYRVVWEP